MITEAVQQLAGHLSRRFFLNALLPTFVFTTITTSVVLACGWSISAASRWWAGLDLLTQLVALFGYVAIVYFLAAAVASQWRNIVRIYEGYPLDSIFRRWNKDAPGKRWHLATMDRLLSKERGNPAQAYWRYPVRADKGKVLPTRLGNILLAGERYADDRYGVDPIYFWPRLYPLLPEEFQRDFTLAITQYQFPLVVSFQASITTIVCSVAALVAGVHPVLFAAISIGGVVVAYGAYVLSLSSAIEMAEQQRAAFDLYRGHLFEAWPTAAEINDEADAFAGITAFVVQGGPPAWEKPAIGSDTT